MERYKVIQPIRLNERTTIKVGEILTAHIDFDKFGRPTVLKKGDQYVCDVGSLTADSCCVKINDSEEEEINVEELSNKILDLLQSVDDKEALLTLSKVIREFDLQVAANLIENNYDPSLLQKGALEDYYYSEGNEDAGHLPLKGILKEVEKVINFDDSESDIQFEEYVVRKYTEEELKEEEKDNDGITWFKRDEEKRIDEILVGFESSK